MPQVDRAPRNIMLVTERLAFRSGGAERVLIETANALEARGHAVEIVTHERDMRPPFFPMRFGVTHTNIRRPDRARSRTRLRLDRWRERLYARVYEYRFPLDRVVWLSKHGAFWRRLEDHINLHRPDVAIAFLPSAIVALGLIRPQYGLRRIASLHNVPERDLCDPARWDPNPFDRQRRMSALHVHDAITVLQPEFRDWFPEDLRRKISIVPNVVRQVSSARRAKFDKEPTVLSVGRIAAVKRYDLLVDAWKLLADDFPGWTLKIFGRGPLHNDIRDRISELGLGGKVRLMGHTSRIDEEYLKASIVAHPARHEGWGLAASEALAAGVPVVGFESCPGINHLVKHGTNGLLVPRDADKIEGLADALSTLMRDEQLRLRLGGAAPASVADYDPDKVYDLWEDLLYEPAASRS